MKKLIALIALLPILFAGCGKEGPADTPEVGGDAWYEALGKTPKNRAPAYEQYAKGDTNLPIDAWRIVGEAEVDYKLSVSGDEADFDMDIKWPDTVFVVYTDLPPDTTIRDTVIKPSPEFSGDLKFHYKVVDKEWKLVSLTPAAVRSDSAGNHVKLDSIKCEVLNRDATYPTLSNPLALLSCYPIADYPYTFQKGDSVKLKVYASGTSERKFPLLFAPTGDSIPDLFNYDTQGGYWYGTWQTNATGHSWAWIDVIDIDIILDPDMKAARAVLWGIPYRVVE